MTPEQWIDQCDTAYGDGIAVAKSNGNTGDNPYDPVLQKTFFRNWNEGFAAASEAEQMPPTNANLP